jgi:hypothetical protein
MEAVCFSETSASIYQSTRRQNPEEQRHSHRRENLKSHDLLLQFYVTDMKGIKHSQGANSSHSVKRNIFEKYATSIKVSPSEIYFSVHKYY